MSNVIEFTPWPKIARLNRDIFITEKLDGTNAAVLIVEQPFGGGEFPDFNRIAIVVDDSRRDENGVPAEEFHVYAQSRNRFITPGKSTDNYGFAGWVEEHAEELVLALGAGRHFGEWWGAGIQRGYGLEPGDKRFSLFDYKKWTTLFAEDDANQLAFYSVPGLGLVPKIYEGPFSGLIIEDAVSLLRLGGSFAANYPRPEGIVVWHTAARISFKVTLEDDAAPAKKGVRNPLDLLPVAAELGLAA